MGWPQVVLLTLWAVNLGVHVAVHGKQRTDRFSFWRQLGTFMTWGSLLWAGGFWDG